MIVSSMFFVLLVLILFHTNNTSSYIYAFTFILYQSYDSYYNHHEQRINRNIFLCRHYNNDQYQSILNYNNIINNNYYYNTVQNRRRIRIRRRNSKLMITFLYPNDNTFLPITTKLIGYHSKQQLQQQQEQVSKVRLYNTGTNNDDDKIQSISNNITTTTRTVTNFTFHHLTNVTRIFCISDLHTDHIQNLNWLIQNQQQQNVTETTSNDNQNQHRLPVLRKTDLLIVAGDISHNISIFKLSLHILLQFCQILFVPGNHEAWLSSSSSSSLSSLSTTNSLSSSSLKHHRNNTRKQEQIVSNTTTTLSTPIKTSFDKLQQCYDICRQMGVYVDPLYISSRDQHFNHNNNNTSKMTQLQPQQQQHGDDNPIWIIPLQSWYDGTLTFDDGILSVGFDKWPWMDFIRCNWDIKRFPSMKSPNERIPDGLVQYFLNENYQHIVQPWTTFVKEHEEYIAPCITVSHFLPNQQSLPDWKDIYNSTKFNMNDWLDHGAGTVSAKFAKVAGTQLLDNQIRSFLLYQNDSNTTSNTTLYPNNIHIFGHSHRPKDFVYNQIRYIHNPLGKPKERDLYMISPNVTFQHIWNIYDTTTNSNLTKDDSTHVNAPPKTNSNQQSQHNGYDHIQPIQQLNSNNNDHGGEVRGPTIIRYWEEYGGGKEMLWYRMDQAKAKTKESRKWINHE